jgi:hypothetical protein
MLKKATTGLVFALWSSFASAQVDIGSIEQSEVEKGIEDFVKKETRSTDPMNMDLAAMQHYLFLEKAIPGYVSPELHRQRNEVGERLFTDIAPEAIYLSSPTIRGMGNWVEGKADALEAAATFEGNRWGVGPDVSFSDDFLGVELQYRPTSRIKTEVAIYESRMQSSLVLDARRTNPDSLFGPVSISYVVDQQSSAVIITGSIAIEWLRREPREPEE